jgi:glutathione synthase/RimK-type ligase-like ATP-grasp enzyme
LGTTSEMVAWDDPAVDWASYSCVVVSSTWDSVERAAEYLSWAREVTAVSKLVNSLPVIEWGFDKVHHKELAGAGIPIVPTTWVDQTSTWAPPAVPDFVIKPSVSAGARETARYPGGDPAALDHVRRLQTLGRTVMVQEYISGVEEEGETDLVFFDGVFSHAVLKRVGLRRGEGVVERPWERMSWAGLVTPSPAQLQVAKRTLTFVQERLECQLPYARVDLVAGAENEPLVLEAELIDPYLSLDMEPLAGKRFADALFRSLTS